MVIIRFRQHYNDTILCGVVVFSNICKFIITLFYLEIIVVHLIVPVLRFTFLFLFERDLLIPVTVEEFESNYSDIRFFELLFSEWLTILIKLLYSFSNAGLFFICNFIRTHMQDLFELFQVVER